MPQRVEEYPSLLWITSCSVLESGLSIYTNCSIPPILLVSAWFARKWYLARRLRVHGIGKGAPGFQTNVRQLRVTPEIAARLQRGEQVSPEEIAAAVAEAEENSRRPPLVEKNFVKEPEEPEVNEWLPPNLTGGPKKRAKGKRK